MKKFNRFAYVYNLLKKRHPNWSHGQLRHCAVYSFQMLDINTLESIAEFSDIGNVTIESEVESSSLSKEKLSFNHYATLECELMDCSSLLNYTDFNDKPLYIEYYIPILVQSRWHKKKRINKKWLRRYGMKEDKILVKCDVNSISPDNSYDPYNLVESTGFNMELNNMQYKFRPDQLRRNLKIERYYG